MVEANFFIDKNGITGWGVLIVMGALFFLWFSFASGR